MRNSIYDINCKIGTVSGKITPARKVQTFSGMTENFYRREHMIHIIVLTCTSINMKWIY